MTQDVAEKAGVPRDYAAFAVPFAATTKMDGCAAIYPAVAALFVAQYYGVALGATDYLLIVLVSVIGSAATAGLTGALVMLTLTLTTLGLPLEGAGLLLATVLGLAQQAQDRALMLDAGTGGASPEAREDRAAEDFGVRAVVRGLLPHSPGGLSLPST